MRSLGRVLLAMALLLGVALWVVGNGAHVTAGGQQRGIQYMRNAGAAKVKPGNIPYLGGAVFAHPTVYAIWWGNPSDFPPDTHDGINHWFEVLNGSAYMNLANQYLFGEQASIHFGGNLYDYSPPPTDDANPTEIGTEVFNVLQANGMKPDPTAIYAVYSSNFPNENFYCAYHTFGTVSSNGTNIHVMYIPNQENQPLCWVQPPELSCNSLSNGLQAGANSTAHELMETMTDPNFDAWVDNTVGEIGDPCNFVYQHCVRLSDGSNWQLQQIWSDHFGACKQE